MSTKLIILAAALILAGPVLAAGGASSGGSSSSGGGGHSGGGGGGHGGGFGGGGGYFGAGGNGGRGAGFGLGGRGAAASTHSSPLASQGATRANHTHTGSAMADKHAAAERSTSKLVGTDHHHHHHPFRREPQDGDFLLPAFFESCSRERLQPWDPACTGPTKSSSRPRGRS